MSIDHKVELLHSIVEAEREAGRVNSLADLTGHKVRRTTITALWAQVQQQLIQLKNEIDGLPDAPPDEQISWAQAVAAMPNLRFLEIDTTGLDAEDEICRFTLVDGFGQIVYDSHIRPTSRLLTKEASRINGIQISDLEQAPTLSEVWEDVQDALLGIYVVSFNLEWDLKQLSQAARRYQLAPLAVVGDCLQRRATQYYHREYYLSLAELCARAGHPLPDPPAQTSIDRAWGQYHFLQAMASAITDVRPPKPPAAASVITDDDDPDDLDSHPF